MPQSLSLHFTVLLKLQKQTQFILQFLFFWLSLNVSFPHVIFSGNLPYSYFCSGLPRYGLRFLRTPIKRPMHFKTVLQNWVFGIKKNHTCWNFYHQLVYYTSHSGSLDLTERCWLFLRQKTNCIFNSRNYLRFERKSEETCVALHAGNSWPARRKAHCLQGSTTPS